MASLYRKDTPDVVKNAEGIHLMTMSTPNGQKTQILLEELAAKYGLEFTFNLIDIRTNEQKKDWFLAINPNGRIPVIIDNTVSPPFPVHETSAQLMYLQSKYDTENEWGFTDQLEKSQMIQWLFFYHGSVQPYQGQVNHFLRVAPEKLPYAIDRFKNEVLRVFGVLEIHLSGKYTGQERDWLAGNGKGKYSIADMSAWPWAKNAPRTSTEEQLKDFPHLLKWIGRVAERPAVKLGISEKYNAK
jgi:glutathione S-transferase